MCELTKNYDKKTFTGYKIVARYKGRKSLYSVAMGIKYPQDGDVIVPKTLEQSRMSTYFTSIILKSPAFHSEMVGRTAAFRKLFDVRHFFRSIVGYKRLDRVFLEIWKVRLSKDLMTGIYCGNHVVAGKHIKFLKRIKS